MGANRDRVVNLLPWSLIQEIDHDSRWGDHYTYLGPGISSLVRSCFKPPKNPVEADCHRELIDKGYVALQSGWPDFFVFGPKNDLFMVEVKSDNDTIKPHQRVIHELLADRGIDVYIRYGTENASYYEVGPSRPWKDRFVG